MAVATRGEKHTKGKEIRTVQRFDGQTEAPQHRLPNSMIRKIHGGETKNSTTAVLSEWTGFVGGPSDRGDAAMALIFI